MDSGFDDMLVRVRADTQGFARDVEAMRGQLEGPLAAGAERAGRAMESAIGRFVRTGKFGFDDLKRVAVSALGEIAAASLRSGVTGTGAVPVLGGLLTAAGALFGLPGRATGGPVTAGRGYVVGERGPEVFVPEGAGRIEAVGRSGVGARQVNVTVNVAAPRDAGAPFMARTGSQVARAVRQALLRAGDDI